MIPQPNPTRLNPALRALPGRLCFLALLILVLGLSSGCESLPFRLEFGREREAGEDDGGLGVDPSEADGPTAAQRSVAWISLHEDLERRLSSRNEGDPLPLDKIANCKRGLVRLREIQPQRSASIDKAHGLYERLEKRGRSADPNWTARVMREVERLVVQEGSS